jgi:hypothetical protein
VWRCRSTTSPSTHAAARGARRVLLLAEHSVCSGVCGCSRRRPLAPVLDDTCASAAVNLGLRGRPCGIRRHACEKG